MWSTIYNQKKKVYTWCWTRLKLMNHFAFGLLCRRYFVYFHCLKINQSGSSTRKVNSHLIMITSFSHITYGVKYLKTFFLSFNYYFYWFTRYKSWWWEVNFHFIKIKIFSEIKMAASLAHLFGDRFIILWSSFHFSLLISDCLILHQKRKSSATRL